MPGLQHWVAMDGHFNPPMLKKLVEGSQASMHTHTIWRGGYRLSICYLYSSVFEVRGRYSLPRD